ncbi:MAG: hypothetical protein KAS32_19625 [Candidatus Peribacteraceae bacterium]|nr:hypothetical protein [Candidatus Peribacteraceae bacterium]
MAGWKSLDPTIRHILKGVGESWFVDGVNGSDSNGGRSPGTAFLTIGAAITVCSAGDVITVGAATYTELALDLNVANVTMVFEPGVLIDPASGTALTISGASCMVTGMHKITPGAGEIGLLVSGAECHVEHGKVLGGATCVSISGSGCMFKDYAAGFPTDTAYAITGEQTRLRKCATVGNAATYGYKINGGADTGVLERCTSSGHETSGFYIDTGSQDWTLLNCSSGGGDGRWVDVDHANVWSGFTFADEVFKEIDMTDATQAFDLFVITGTVEIEDLNGQVEEVTNGELGNCQFRVHGTDGATDTDLTTPTDCENLPAKSALLKIGDASIALSVASSAAPVVIENANFREPIVKSVVVADSAGTTTIQFYSDDGAGAKDGKIHFHCKWKPKSDDGFVTPA